MHINTSHSIRTRCRSARINKGRSAKGRSSPAKGMSFAVTRPDTCRNANMHVASRIGSYSKGTAESNDLLMPQGSTSCLLIRKATSLASTNYLVLGTGPMIRRSIGPTSRRFFGSCLYDSLYLVGCWYLG